MIKINKKVWVKVVNWSFKIIFQMHFFKVITIFLIGFFFIGCKFIDLKKISAEEIKLESSWSEKDQPPSFEECEKFSNLIDQKLCFKKKSQISYILVLVHLELNLKSLLNLN